MGRRGQPKDTPELCRAYHPSPKHQLNLSKGCLTIRIFQSNNKRKYKNMPSMTCILTFQLSTEVMTAISRKVSESLQHLQIFPSVEGLKISSVFAMKNPPKFIVVIASLNIITDLFWSFLMKLTYLSGLVTQKAIKSKTFQNYFVFPSIVRGLRFLKVVLPSY